MKIKKSHLIKLLKEILLKEINLNVDPEIFDSQQYSNDRVFSGNADSIHSQRTGLASSAFSDNFYSLEEEASESDTESLDEFSGAGAIGGFSLPLGAKPENYNKKNK